MHSTEQTSSVNPVNSSQTPDAEWQAQEAAREIYEMTLVADRAVNSEPLSQTFKIAVTDLDMSNWQGAGATMFFTFSVEN